MVRFVGTAKQVGDRPETRAAPLDQRRFLRLWPRFCASEWAHCFYEVRSVAAQWCDLANIERTGDREGRLDGCIHEVLVTDDFRVQPVIPPIPGQWHRVSVVDV